MGHIGMTWFATMQRRQERFDPGPFWVGKFIVYHDLRTSVKGIPPLYNTQNLREHCQIGPSAKPSSICSSNSASVAPRVLSLAFNSSPSVSTRLVNATGGL